MDARPWAEDGERWRERDKERQRESEGGVFCTKHVATLGYHKEGNRRMLCVRHHSSGGDLSRSSRFLKEVMKRMKTSLGKHKSLLVRAARAWSSVQTRTRRVARARRERGNQVTAKQTMQEKPRHYIVTWWRRIAPGCKG